MQSQLAAMASPDPRGERWCGASACRPRIEIVTLFRLASFCHSAARAIGALLPSRMFVAALNLLPFSIWLCFAISTRSRPKTAAPEATRADTQAPPLACAHLTTACSTEAISALCRQGLRETQSPARSEQDALDHPARHERAVDHHGRRQRRDAGARYSTATIQWSAKNRRVGRDVAMSAVPQQRRCGARSLSHACSSDRASISRSRGVAAASSTHWRSSGPPLITSIDRAEPFAHPSRLTRYGAISARDHGCPRSGRRLRGLDRPVRDGPQLRRAVRRLGSRRLPFGAGPGRRGIVRCGLPRHAGLLLARRGGVGRRRRARRDGLRQTALRVPTTIRAQEEPRRVRLEHPGHGRRHFLPRGGASTRMRVASFFSDGSMAASAGSACAARWISSGRNLRWSRPLRRTHEVRVRSSRRPDQTTARAARVAGRGIGDLSAVPQ